LVLYDKIYDVYVVTTVVAVWLSLSVKGFCALRDNIITVAMVMLLQDVYYALLFYYIIVYAVLLNSNLYVKLCYTSK
jgi:hypothetical protein